MFSSAKDNFIDALQNAIVAKDNVIQAQDDYIKEMGNAIVAKDNVIQAQDNIISAKNNRIKELENIVAEQDNLVQLQKKLISYKDNLISEIKKQGSSGFSLISTEEWRWLMQLTHPDKHKDTLIATNVTSWLIENRPVETK